MAKVTPGLYQTRYVLCTSGDKLLPTGSWLLVLGFKNYKLSFVDEEGQLLEALFGWETDQFVMGHVFVVEK